MTVDTSYGLTSDQIKAIGITIMFVVAVVAAGVLPVLLKNWAVECAAGDAFSAGILLVIGLMHLLPEATEKIHEAGSITAFTYITLVLVQHVAIGLLTHPGRTRAPNADKYVDDDAEACRNYSTTKDEGSHLAAGSSPTPPKTMIVPCGHDHEPDDSHVDKEVELQALSVSSMCLFVALGVHCIIEGFAAGAPLEAKTASMNNIAIIAHKGFAGYALGQSIINANYGIRPFIVMVSVFSILSPIGVAIGWGFQFEADSTAAAVANAISAGTFVHVACSEVLPTLFRKHGRLLQKTIGLLAGAGLMVVTLYFAAHEHKHGPGDHSGHNH